MTRTIYCERIPSTDPRLKRHVLHDSESRRYPVQVEGLAVASVRWTRRVPIFDQGSLGSCTGNAGLGCLGTDPLYATVPSRLAPLLVGQGAYPFTEAGAVQLYSDATAADDYPGQYPPTDTGSDGLTIAKVLKAHGQISGYRHAFSLDDALRALTTTALITGINWYQDMFNPDGNGIVHPTGGLAGGHEIVVDEYDDPRGLVGFTNSWGSGWGLAGRFYMRAEDYGALLAQQGDVTAFVPVTAPPPTPTPDPVLRADDELGRALLHNDWAHGRHMGDSRRVALAGLEWLRVHGRFGG